MVLEKKKLEEVREEAELAFWDVVAKRFPEIKTGDVSPEMVFVMETEMEEWIQKWYFDNLPNDKLEELGYGKCDSCGIILPIGRGENFSYCEDSHDWLCENCYTCKHERLDDYCPFMEQNPGKICLDCGKIIRKAD